MEEKRDANAKYREGAIQEAEWAVSRLKNVRMLCLQIENYDAAEVTDVATRLAKSVLDMIKKDVVDSKTETTTDGDR